MKRRPSKRETGGLHSLKTLISAGALVTTLGGWAVLGLKDPRSGTTAAPQAGGQLPPEILAQLEPLPTLVAPPTFAGIQAPSELPTPMRQVLRPVSRPAPPAEDPDPDATSRSSG